MGGFKRQRLARILCFFDSEALNAVASSPLGSCSRTNSAKWHSYPTSKSSLIRIGQNSTSVRICCHGMSTCCWWSLDACSLLNQFPWKNHTKSSPQEEQSTRAMVQQSVTEKMQIFKEILINCPWIFPTYQDIVGGFMSGNWDVKLDLSILFTNTIVTCFSVCCEFAFSNIRCWTATLVRPIHHL